MGQTPDRTPSATFVAYVTAVASLAFVVLAAGVLLGHRPNVVEILFFWMLHGVAHWKSLEVPPTMPMAVKRTPPRLPMLSGGFLVLLTASLATGPVTATIVGMLSPVSPGGRRGPLRDVFNGAQNAVYAGSASLVFHAVRDGGGSLWITLAATSLAGLVAVSFNTGLVGMGLAILARTQKRRFPGWRTLLWPTPVSFGFSFVALLIAVLYGQAGAPAAIFFLTPLFVLRAARLAKLELDASHERTLRAFVRAVEMKDPYTSRHSERVASIAVELHREIGTDERTIEQRYYGALLHDLGKVGVPGSVLTKPGPLTPSEYDAVKRHPGLGAETAAEIEFLAHLVPEIRHHHERMDGAGYPDGLAGDEIPWSARVLAVADVFDALTSERPYRRAFSYSEAMHMMRLMAGPHLDPRLVEALTSLLEQGHVFAIPSTTVAPLPAPKQVGAERARQA